MHVAMDCMSREPAYTFKSARVVMRMGDVLDCTEQVLVHCCDCVSIEATGETARTFERFPHANVYESRSNDEYMQRDFPGDMILRGDGDRERYVAAVMSQIYNGPPKYPESMRDGYSVRIEYFESALYRLATEIELTSVAFAWKLDCAENGAKWYKYARVIDEFASRQKVAVALYKA